MRPETGAAPAEPGKGPPGGAPPAATDTRTFLRLFTAVMLPMFLAAVDQTLLATATPVIADELGGLRDTSWIAVGYLLAAAATTAVYGRLGDRLGRRAVLLGALAVFSAGSLACALAPSLPALVAARVLQGLGGGGLMTLSQALIGELVTPRERARFQGYFAAMFSLASIGGPVLGGLVVAHGHWRWLFAVNLPLCALAAWRLLGLPPGQPGRAGPPANLTGTLLFPVVIVLVLYWLSSGGHRFAWLSWQSAAWAMAGTALALLLFLRERRHPRPFLPLDLLRMPAVAYGTLTTALFAACMFAMVFFLPVYLQLGLARDAAASGLLLLPLTLGMATGSTTSGRVISRTGSPGPVPVAGMSTAAVGLLLMGLLPPGNITVSALGFVVGAGFGTVMPTMQITLQTAAGRERLGAATSLVSLSRSLGAACGTALFGALVFALLPDTDPARLAESARLLPADTLVPAFHRAFVVVAGVAALTALAASRIPRLRIT